jgi:dTDP-3-amino-3,4,6-trideoxy-alpha-D-glucose transaminase
MSTRTHLRVPFLDLKAQYASLELEMHKALDEVLMSAQFVGGPWVKRFEEDFARFVGAKYALGVGSGTAALELALSALDVGAGDEVIVPANSFFATAEAVSRVGARPLFADVNPLTFHLDISSAERVLTARTKAIIPVHLFGRAMDMEPVERFAGDHHLDIIEDAAQAHGVGRGGRMVGGSGRLCCFSFYPGKNLGAYGEAGAVTTGDLHQADKIRILRDHGSPTKYEHVMIGANERLDAIQAAVLSVKLPHLLDWNRARARHARNLAQALRDSPIRPPEIPPAGEHNFHLFVVRTERRDELKSFLAERGIATGIHYPEPLHLTKAYQSLSYPGEGALPVSESLAKEILSLPMYAELSDQQIDYVIQALQDFAG